MWQSPQRTDGPAANFAGYFMAVLVLFSATGLYLATWYLDVFSSAEGGSLVPSKKAREAWMRQDLDVIQLEKDRFIIQQY